MKQEVRDLIEAKIRSLLNQAADQIRLLYFDQAWALIDEAQIYREAIGEDNPTQ